MPETRKKLKVKRRKWIAQSAWRKARVERRMVVIKEVLVFVSRDCDFCPYGAAADAVVAGFSRSGSRTCVPRMNTAPHAVALRSPKDAQ